MKEQLHRWNYDYIVFLTTNSNPFSPHFILTKLRLVYAYITIFIAVEPRYNELPWDWGICSL